MNVPHKILLVEDNEGDAILTIEALQNAKMKSEITVIEDGETAMKYLEREGEYVNAALPDLILLDLNLPNIDGREVLHFVKNNNALKKIPVVMLTTSSLQSDIHYAYNNHANCYIVKSDNPHEFNNAISALKKFWVQCVTYPNKN